MSVLISLTSRNESTRTNGVWYQKDQIIFCVHTASTTLNGKIVIDYHWNPRILEFHEDFTQVQVGHVYLPH